MKIRRRTIVAMAAASVLAMQLPVFNAAAQETPESGGTLIATWGGLEPQSIFVPAGGGGAPEFTQTKVLETLLLIDKQLDFHPNLATEVTPSEDFLSYTIKIRDDVTWHDGKPFTIDDLVFNAEYYWKPVAGGPAFQHYEGIEATGPNEAVIRFAQPTPEFFFKSILSRVLVVPKHVYEGKEFATNEANNAPIGTGPFKFKEWVRGSHIEFDKNENYWADGQPYVDRLIIRYWRDPSSRTAALEAGEVAIGVFNPIPPSDIPRLVESGKFVVSTDGFVNFANASTIEFNSRNPVVSEVPVRRALMHAFDRQFIADVVYSGNAKPGTGYVSSSNSKFYTGDVDQYEFDPELAKKLLDEAGYPEKEGGRFTVTLLAAGWFEENGRIGQYLKQQFEDIGVTVDLQVPDRATSFKAIYTDYAFDIAISNHAATTELVPVQTNYFTTSGIMQGVPFRNANGYSNPELDEIVARLAVETDDAARTTLAHDMQRILARDVPITILAEVLPTIVSSTSIKGWDHYSNVLSSSWASVWIDR